MLLAVSVVVAGCDSSGGLTPATTKVAPRVNSEDIVMQKVESVPARSPQLELGDGEARGRQ
jgi:hypothetical protein